MVDKTIKGKLLGYGFCDVLSDGAGNIGVRREIAQALKAFEVDYMCLLEFVIDFPTPPPPLLGFGWRIEGSNLWFSRAVFESWVRCLMNGYHSCMLLGYGV